jgi:glycosyltransferase involved in cell wall biosynthesis
LARILVICDTLPINLADGLHLRVYHLCRELAKFNECFFLGPVSEQVDGEKLKQIGFSDHRALEPRPREGRSWRRHCRLSNARFLQISSPDYYRRSAAVLNEVVEAWNIDVILCFAPGLSELALASTVPTMLDFTDSRTLTAERVSKNRGRHKSLVERAVSLVRSKRDTARERHLVRTYGVTTTISEQDRQALLRVSGVPADKVYVIPNGVSDAALAVGKVEKEAARSMVFWGNLDFPPNWTAVEFFFDQVFLPFLADKDVAWHIVGRGASEELLRKVRHRSIHFHGFVEDLFRFAASKSLMINPMVEGSGLKNKVLEALAIYLPVVSTHMGIEAINGKAGQHFLVADSPRAIAEHIETILDDADLREKLTAQGRALVESEYTWSVVGERLNDLLSDLLR